MINDIIAIGFTILTSLMVSYFLYKELTTNYKANDKH